VELWRTGLKNGDKLNSGRFRGLRIGKIIWRTGVGDNLNGGITRGFNGKEVVGGIIARFDAGFDR
jgi:hypothetical protein